MKLSLLFAVVTFAGCDCGSDAAAPDSGPNLPTLDRGHPPALESFGERRGLIPARGIIHLHSPLSHDACDGNPRDEDTGAINEPCLADQRAALCDLRIDFASLTEHDASMADEEFDDLFLVRGDDELVNGPGGTPIAKRILCDSGHQVLAFTGGENDLMPIMIESHPAGTVQERHDYYNAGDVAAVTAFRENGGLVVVNHAEGRTLADLELLAPDGMEVYQLHANIDPDIRVEDLGLDASGAIRAVADFADTRPEGPEPDLALISFLEPMTPSLEKWDALLGQGRRIFGTGGTDAHQNALPILLRDEERADSFRRMMRWFSNVALVADPSDPIAVKAAVAEGRFFIAFELFGTPNGFDVHAASATDTAELGAEVLATDGYELRVTVPTVYALDPTLPTPVIRARIIRAGASASTEVAEGSGPTLSVPLDAVAAYRVEILITPHHLGPYLGILGTDHAEREQVWIYSNPIYVR